MAEHLSNEELLNEVQRRIRDDEIFFRKEQMKQLTILLLADAQIYTDSGKTMSMGTDFMYEFKKNLYGLT